MGRKHETCWEYHGNIIKMVGERDIVYIYSVYIVYIYI